MCEGEELTFGLAQGKLGLQLCQFYSFLQTTQLRRNGEWQY